MNKLKSLIFHGSFLLRNRVSFKRGLVLLLFLVGVEVWGGGEGTERLYPTPLLVFPGSSGSFVRMSDLLDGVIVVSDKRLLFHQQLSDRPMPFRIHTAEKGSANAVSVPLDEIFIPEHGSEESDAMLLNGQVAIEIPAEVSALSFHDSGFQKYYVITINFRPDGEPWDFMSSRHFPVYLGLLARDMTDQQLGEADDHMQEGVSGFRAFMKTALDSRTLQTVATRKNVDQIYPQERQLRWRPGQKHDHQLNSAAKKQPV